MKKVLSILLALCITTCMLGSLGTTLNAAENQPSVIVADVELTSEGYWLNDGEGGITAEGANKNNYNVQYEDGTLTLKDAYITKCYDWSSGDYCAAIYAKGDLNIKLLGDNTVIGRDNKYSYGVRQTNGTLTISGSGTLNVSSGTSQAYSNAITCDNIVINGGTIIATSGMSKTRSLAIVANDSILITGGSVIAAGNQTTSDISYPMSIGITANIIEISGGTVTATGDIAYYRSVGLDGTAGVIISGDAVVHAKGADATGSGDRYSYGICVAYSISCITISGGTVIAESGDATTTSALIQEPILSDFEGYEWRTSNEDDFNTGTYVWTEDQTYVEIKPGFAPVADITMTSAGSVAVNTDLVLAGTVSPARATNKTIVWSVADEGGTGAAITDGVFRATTPGTATVTATVAGGTTDGDFSKTFPITVTKSQSNPGSSKSDSDDSGIISVTDPTTGVRAKGDFDGNLVISYLDENGATYKELLKSIGGGYTVFKAYEVKAGDYNGSLTLTFPVGDKHNGKEYVVLHKTSSGEIKTYKGTVSDGKVVITVSSLSPFMITIKDGVRIPETGAPGLFDSILGYLQNFVYTVFY